MKIIIVTLLLCCCFSCSEGTEASIATPTIAEPMNTDLDESLHLSAIAFLPWGEGGMTAQFNAAPQTSVAMGGLATPPAPIRANITTRVCGDRVVLRCLNEVALVEHQQGFRPGKFVIDAGKRIQDVIAFQKKVYVLVEASEVFSIEIHAETGAQEGEISLEAFGERSEFAGLLSSNDRLYLVQKGQLNTTIIKDPSLIEVDPAGSLGESHVLDEGMVKGQIYGNDNTVHYVKEDASGRYQVNHHPLVQSKIHAAPQGKDEYIYLGSPIGVDEKNHIYGSSDWTIGKVDAGNRFKGSVALENAFVKGNDIWYSHGEGEEVIVYAQNGLGTEERYRISLSSEAVRKYNIAKWTFRGFDEAGDLILSGRVPSSGATQFLTFLHSSGDLLGPSGAHDTVMESHHQLTVPQSWSIDAEGGIWMASMGPLGIYLFRAEMR